MSKTLSDWLIHFENLHPVGIDMGLSRVAQVWKKLCEQENITQLAKEKVITVAGTNGKGSTCQMLSLLLSVGEKRVGMYTSPHIHHFRERVQINGESVDDAMLVRAFSAIDCARDTISLSYFEATTLAGLLIFAWEQVDFAVLEVGLGGRLDAINIIDADAVIITSIGLDHQAYLGSDLSQIAVEKAGVCRPNAPCVYAETGVYDSVVELCQKKQIPLLANGFDYHIDGATLSFEQSIYEIPSRIAALGQHQIANCAGVLVLLKTLGLLPDYYQRRLAPFALPGRLEKIASQPDVIIDVAHNEAAAKALANFLQRRGKHYNNVYAVIGMLKDKDHCAVLSAFQGIFDEVYLGSTAGERGLKDTALADSAKTVFSCPIHTCNTLTAALLQARQQAASADLIIAFGSFLVVEELSQQ